MTQFFVEGGMVFMSILTLLFLLIIGISVLAIITVFRENDGNPEKADKLLGYVKSLALFTLAFAVFSQLLGLADIFGYLANKDANVASSILAKGIKVTFHPTMYGLIIYLISSLIYIGLRFKLAKT